MSHIRSIAHNTLIQIAGKVITITIGLVAFGLMTRYLGNLGYGHYTTVYGFLVVLAIMTDLGLQMTTTQLIADPAYDETTILNNAIGLRITTSLVFLAITPAIALTVPYPLDIKIGIALGAIGFVGSALTTTLTCYFQKHLVIHQLVIAEVCGKVILLTGTIAAISYNAGLLALVAATVFDALVTCLVAYTLVRRRIPLRFSRQPEIWRLLWTRTWPIAITIGLNLIYFKGDIVLMSLLRTQTEVGLYGAPYRVLEFLINMMYLVLGLLLPLIAGAIAIRDSARLRTIVQATFDVLLMIGLPLVIGGWFVAKPLMIFVAGPNFALSGEIMRILLIATFLIFIASLFGYIVVAAQQQKRMIKFYAFNAIIAILGYYGAIKYFGYLGAAWMTVATEAIMLLSAGYVMYRSTDFMPRLTLLPKTLTACAIMAVTLWFLPHSIHVGFTVLIGAFVYAICIYLVRAIDPTVLREIFSKTAIAEKS
jgi:O-antigen/teichoic acid export membrane protein